MLDVPQETRDSTSGRMNVDQRHPKPAGPLSFGPFTLSVQSRLLAKNAAPVQIGGRSLDILIVLIESAGEVVSKRELMERVWTGLTVDESSLRVHINGLRKALGDGQDGARYIANVPGRGYAFVAPVGLATASDGRVPSSTPASTERPARLPPVLARMVGREEIVQSLAAQLLDVRVVSLVGPGGIGKTTVVVKAAHQLWDEFDGEIYFIGLSSITEPALVHATIASMLGTGGSLGAPLDTILAVVRRKRCLLVLDGCEHLIEPIAELADAIFQEAPLAHLLATSREGLRVEGEQVVRLTPLQCPPEGRALTAAESLAYPAVELFVDRARASAADFILTDEDAPTVSSRARSQPMMKATSSPSVA